jgi:hypothetical protein
MKKIVSLFIFLLPTIVMWAKDGDQVGDTMRSNGRIYVVVAVVLTILIGLILYIVRIDRKISKLEKQ